MRLDYLDRHSRLDSPVHRLPAGLKLAVALSLVVAITATPPSRLAWLAGVAACLLLLVLLARLPWRYVLTRVLLFEPLIAGVALLALFQPGGGRLFLALIIKSTLCLLSMVILSSTTPFSRMLTVLRRVRVPAILITTLALMYRYLFVLIDQSQRMRRARASRTFSAGRRRAWRNLGSVIAHLFVRASQRAERIYAAMLARGWQ